MFGFEKKLKFIESLTSYRAEEFSRDQELKSQVRKALDTDTSKVITDDSHQPFSQTPEMTLAEDLGSMGDQIETDISDFSSSRSLDKAVGQSSSDRMPGRIDSRDSFQEFKRLTEDLADDSPGRIMKRKLNHFEIERVAEKIKDRLEIEYKIQKERWCDDED